MRKIITLCLALLMTFSGIARAADDNKTVKYLKGTGQYNSNIVYIARDKNTGQIIPLAADLWDGYLYAYLNTGDNFIIEKKSNVLNYTDLNEWQKLDRYMIEIVAREVLVGYEDGTFRPEKELTRAEMATVFTRLFSIPESNTKSCFGDVTDDSWCKGYIMALAEKGVLKEDVYFNPDELVTREQFVTMMYRMLNDIGCIDTEGEADFSNYKDYNAISDYAKIAYNSLISNGYQTPYELIENDIQTSDDDEIYAEPQRSITRYECAKYLYYFINTFFSENAPAIKKDTAPDIEIPILDGSTSTYDITKNIYNAFYYRAENLESFPKQHSKTTNSYKKLIDGDVEMIFVPDAGEEVQRYAEEKGVKLKFIPIANEALIFFTGTKNKVDTITTEQLYNIYVNDSIKNWNELGGDDAALVAYCRNNDSGSHAQMEKFILNGKELNENIVKEHTSWFMSSILTEVDNYNKQNEGQYAIGYSLYYYYFNNQNVLGPLDLKLMNVNGVEPKEETIANGTYPYTTNYYAVVRDEENEKVDAFLKFMKGDFGKEIIKRSGLGIIR